jgi:hypothetical protein
VISEKDSSQYIPGSCNIGIDEIRRRYRIGFAGLFIAVILVIIFHFTDVDRIWKLFIFLPVFYSVSGFIQAINKFCYVYGFRHVFSLHGKRNFTAIRDIELRKKDRSRALQIVTMTTILSVMITAFYYFVT